LERSHELPINKLRAKSAEDGTFKRVGHLKHRNIRSRFVVLLQCMHVNGPNTALANALYEVDEPGFKCTDKEVSISIRHTTPFGIFCIYKTVFAAHFWGRLPNFSTPTLTIALYGKN